MIDLSFLPPEIIDLVKTIKPSQVWIRTLPASPGAKCPVCNDGRWISVSYPVSGPFISYPSVSHDYQVEYFNDHYWTCKKETFPCETCGAKELLVDKYWQDSGLHVEERAWRLDYYAKLDKDLPVMSLRDWLTQIPRIQDMKILYGTYGMGKSGMGKAMVGACIRAGIRAHYCTAEDFLRLCRSSFKSMGMSEEAIVAEYISYRFLCIDEVDPERISMTDYGRAALFALLNKRYDARRHAATLLISNQEPDTLWGYLASRMEDAERIPVSGINLRGRGEPDTLWMNQ